MTSQTFQPYMVRCECAWCGNAFYAKRKDARYCSTSHKLKHQRWRKNLNKHHHEALTRLDNIGTYLGNEDSKETAIHLLKGLEERINSLLYHAKVQVVK